MTPAMLVSNAGASMHSCHPHAITICSMAADLVHGVKKPLHVGSKALCQLVDALDCVKPLRIVRGVPQVVHHLAHNDLQAAMTVNTTKSEACLHRVAGSCQLLLHQQCRWVKQDEEVHRLAGAVLADLYIARLGHLVQEL